jgi:hypothetical protein
MNYREVNSNEKNNIELTKKMDDIVLKELSVDFEEQNEEQGLKGGQSYQKAFYLAKISLELEKYEDSLRYVEEMVKLNDSEFSDEERDVFITAFRFLISDKRKAWRISYK